MWVTITEDPSTQPPKDGSWIIQLNDDGSGVLVMSYYKDEKDNEGWHMLEDSGFDGPGHCGVGFVWASLPKDFKPWFALEPWRSMSASEFELVRC